MKKLIAIIPVLYLSHQYKPGEELPASNQEMVKAWIEAESAYWQEDPEEDDKEKETQNTKKDINEISDVKAKSTTVQAGQEGSAIPAGKGDNLTGRVPQTPGRKKGK